MGLVPIPPESELLKFVDEACDRYADVDVDVAECCKAEAERRGLSQEIAEAAYKVWFRKEAIANGIPASVVDGKTKLTDHFSQDYIDSQCGRKK